MQKQRITTFFMLKIRWYIFITEIEYHLKKFFYCNWGWHNVHSGSIETINHKSQVIITNFVKCTNCEKYFFPTKKDKNNFKRIKNQEKTICKKAFDILIKKYINIK